MSPLFDWLLGLDRLPAGEGALGLRFATPPAPWIMLSGALVASYLIHVIYRKENLRGRARWLAAAMRLAAVMIVLFLLGQPQIVMRRTIVDPSCVAVLLDRSASMALHDGASRAPLPAQDRWNQALAALSGDRRSLMSLLGAGQQVRAYAFDSDAERLGVADDVGKRTELGGLFAGLRPVGAGSDLVSAARRVLEDSQGLRLAAIVVLGDGRQTTPAQTSGLLAEARSRAVPIHVIAAGSGRTHRDVRIDSAWCEDEVFVNDTVLVRIRLRATGLEPSAPIELQLTDQGSGERLASRSVRCESPGQPREVELVFRPGRSGRRVLRVSATADAEDEIAGNNSAEFSLRVRDEKIGVLYVEGDPRYEYRYLKNLLLRESTVESSCLLLGASAGFPQEGSRPIQQFPQSVEELRGYDVIILGDVDPRADWITPTQLSLLSDHVLHGGAGIIFLAGEKHVPRGLRGTTLEKLLPVRIDDSLAATARGPILAQYPVTLTPEGRASSLFRFDSDPGTEPTDSLPGWYWSAGVLGPQPACSVLAVNPKAGDLPLVVMGRTGAGRSLFVGSDDIWRWRKLGGEHYYDTFWMQAIRTLARQRKLGQRGAWRLESDRRRYELGEPVTLRLRPVDLASSIEGAGATVQVLDTYGGLVEHVALSAMDSGAGFSGSFTPVRIGPCALRGSAPELPGNDRPPTCDIEVVATQAERLRPEADHEFLRALAAQTDGVFVRAGDSLDELVGGIPDRRVEHPDDLEEPMWDKPFMLVLFALVLSVEWVVRRTQGMP